MLRSNLILNLALLVNFFLSLTFSQLLATTYEVGPGRTYSSILQVPTHNLQAGDSVKVYYQATAYKEKFLLHGVGTANNPIHFIGIADLNGNKPILEGTDAQSSAAYNYFNEDRQVVLIGQFGVFESDFLTVDGFEVRGANNFNSFTDDSGNSGAYQANAAGIRVSWGRNITIRNCDIHSNGNGIQNGDGAGQNLLIEYSHVYNNGLCTWNNSFIHSFYLSSGSNSTVTIQFCHVGDLLSNGQQVRSRAETTVIRYNWIEGGRNSSLDLMEDVDSFHVYIADAYVYGNVIIKPDSSENARIIHFGGDQPNSYRRGTLYFFNNTLVIKDSRTWGTKRVFAISSDSAYVVADNNIFYKPSGSTYELLNGSANLSGSNNWISSNINGIGAFSSSITGTQPGFVDPLAEDYHLKCSSVCSDLLSSYPYPPNHPLASEYVLHSQGQLRAQNGLIDLGALETVASAQVFLGNDTTINSSATLLLNAGSGYQSYLWSDGGSNSSAIVASPPYAVGTHSIHVTATDSNSCVGSDTINVTILGPLSLEESLKYFRLYPNPAQERVNIEAQHISDIEIWNMQGQIVAQAAVNGTSKTLELSHLPKGIYIVRIAGTGGMAVSRLVLE